MTWLHFATNSNSETWKIKMSELIIVQSLFYCLSPKKIAKRRYNQKFKTVFTTLPRSFTPEQHSYHIKQFLR